MNGGLTSQFRCLAPEVAKTKPRAFCRHPPLHHPPPSANFQNATQSFGVHFAHSLPHFHPFFALLHPLLPPPIATFLFCPSCPFSPLFFLILRNFSLPSGVPPLLVLFARFLPSSSNMFFFCFHPFRSLLIVAIPLLFLASVSFSSPMIDSELSPVGRYYRTLWSFNPKRSRK